MAASAAASRMPKWPEACWVKLPGYPFWPARVAQASEVTPNVRELQSSSDEVLVRFFGTHDYAWVLPSQIVEFAVNFSRFEKKSRAKAFRVAVDEAKDWDDIIQTGEVPLKEALMLQSLQDEAEENSEVAALIEASKKSLLKKKEPLPAAPSTAITITIKPPKRSSTSASNGSSEEKQNSAPEKGAKCYSNAANGKQKKQNSDMVKEANESERKHLRKEDNEKLFRGGETLHTQKKNIVILAKRSDDEEEEEDGASAEFRLESASLDECETETKEEFVADTLAEEIEEIEIEVDEESEEDGEEKYMEADEEAGEVLTLEDVEEEIDEEVKRLVEAEAAELEALSRHVDEKQIEDDAFVESKTEVCVKGEDKDKERKDIIIREQEIMMEDTKKRRIEDETELVNDIAFSSKRRKLESSTADDSITQIEGCLETETKLHGEREKASSPHRVKEEKITPHEGHKKEERQKRTKDELKEQGPPTVGGILTKGDAENSVNGDSIQQEKQRKKRTTTTTTKDGKEGLLAVQDVSTLMEDAFIRMKKMSEELTEKLVAQNNTLVDSLRTQNERFLSSIEAENNKMLVQQRELWQQTLHLALKQQKAQYEHILVEQQKKLYTQISDHLTKTLDEKMNQVLNHYFAANSGVTAAGLANYQSHFLNLQTSINTIHALLNSTLERGTRLHLSPPTANHSVTSPSSFTLTPLSSSSSSASSFATIPSSASMSTSLSAAARPGHPSLSSFTNTQTIDSELENVIRH